MRSLHRWLPWFLAVLVGGCSPGPTPALTAAPTDSVEPTPSVAPLPPSEDSGPMALTLWVPPRFDPDADDDAGHLLADRLRAFDSSHPGITLDWRVKDERGPAGLIETLRAANTAAPTALPDLIALDPTGMYTAALKGLITPMDGIIATPTTEDWYPHAAQAASIDGAFYGYPFASDATVLAYRASAFDTPPLSWSTLLDSNRTFVFPAGDPNALFTLVQYQSLGGGLRSDSGLPTLDPTALSSVLAFFASARTAGILPRDVTDYSTNASTWESLKSGRVYAAVAPLSRYLAEQGAQFISVAPLPTQDGAGASLGWTWSWAVVTTDPDRQAALADLLSWLQEPGFLGPWTEALGLVPPQPAALDNWSQDDRAAIAALLAASLQARPGEETLATFGPPLHEAVDAVLNESRTPDIAALAAAQAIQRP
jgi:ABC-type glycerol-3-phosphate transport system substrate-binding protein